MFYIRSDSNYDSRVNKRGHGKDDSKRGGNIQFKPKPYFNLNSHDVSQQTIGNPRHTINTVMQPCNQVN